jgi:hypothetical protein
VRARSRRLRRQRRKWGQCSGDTPGGMNCYVMIRYVCAQWVCRKNGEVRQRRVELLGYDRNCASEWRNSVQAWAIVPWKLKASRLDPPRDPA